MRNLDDNALYSYILARGILSQGILSTRKGGGNGRTSIPVEKKYDYTICNIQDFSFSYEVTE
jgi:hypothetical protein